MAPPQLGTDDLAAAAALFLLLMASYCFAIIIRLRRRPSSRRRAVDNARVPPPSPPGLPIIGNMHQLGRGDHHLKLQALAQRHGDVFLLRLGTVPALVVSSAAAAEEVLRHQDHVFCGRPQQRTARGILYGCRDVAFCPYGERWRQLRRVASLHLLSARRVDSLRALRAQEVAALVGRIRRAAASNAAAGMDPGIKINVSELVVGLTNAVISRAVFGDRIGGMDPASLRAMMKDVLDLLETIAVSDMFPRLRWVDWVMGLDAMVKRTAAKLDDVLEGAIQAHEKSSGNSNGDGEAAAARDLLDDLLSVVKEGGEGFMLDRVDVKALVLDFFLAGTDTTSKAIERAMALLIKNPREMTKVQDEVRQVVAAQGGVLEEQHLGRMSRLQATLKEAMRLHPPVPLLVPRETIRDAKLHGYDIPAKTRVIVNAWAIGRDSRSWENAGEFLPERFMRDGDDASGGDSNCKGGGLRFIPFGAGRRGCPGNAFATRLAELALANLLFYFDWELPEGQDVESFEVAESSSGMSPALTLVVKPPNRHELQSAVDTF